jgi:hypothetical protein
MTEGLCYKAGGLLRDLLHFVTSTLEALAKSLWGEGAHFATQSLLYLAASSSTIASCCCATAQYQNMKAKTGRRIFK